MLKNSLPLEANSFGKMVAECNSYFKEEEHFGTPVLVIKELYSDIVEVVQFVVVMKLISLSIIHKC